MSLVWAWQEWFTTQTWRCTEGTWVYSTTLQLVIWAVNKVLQLWHLHQQEHCACSSIIVVCYKPGQLSFCKAHIHTHIQRSTQICASNKRNSLGTLTYFPILRLVIILQTPILHLLVTKQSASVAWPAFLWGGGEYYNEKMKNLFTYVAILNCLLYTLQLSGLFYKETYQNMD